MDGLQIECNWRFFDSMQWHLSQINPLEDIFFYIYCLETENNLYWDYWHFCVPKTCITGIRFPIRMCLPFIPFDTRCCYLLLRTEILSITSSFSLYSHDRVGVCQKRYISVFVIDLTFYTGLPKNYTINSVSNHYNASKRIIFLY